MNYFVVDSVARCAEVRLWLWRAERQHKQERAVRQVLRSLQAMKRSFPIVEPRLLRLYGLRRRALGDEAGAARALFASERASRRLAMPYDEARALLARSATDPYAHGVAVSRLQRLQADPYAASPL
jgi:hypothetical protein